MGKADIERQLFTRVDDEGKNDEITHNVITKLNVSPDLSIKDWYAKWIQYAFKQERQSFD